MIAMLSLRSIDDVVVGVGDLLPQMLNYIVEGTENLIWDLGHKLCKTS